MRLAIVCARTSFLAALLLASASCAPVVEKTAPPPPSAVPVIETTKTNDTVQPIREHFPRRGIVWLGKEGGHTWARE